MLHFGPIRLSDDTVYYHITHWKAGSQWVLSVLRGAFGQAVVEPQPKLAHVLERPPEPGRILPCCYMIADKFRKLSLPPKVRRFVVIRDLRDTLVSGYFSIRYSHASNQFIDESRAALERASLEEGLILLMEGWLKASANIQKSWIAEGEAVIRLEDFMKEPAETLYQAFSKHWGLRLRMSQAERLIRNHSYEHHSRGRPPGQEDISAHYRKGVQGDWRNHFTSRVIEHFKKLYNETLILTGYEKSDDWGLDRPATYEPTDESRAEATRH